LLASEVKATLPVSVVDIITSAEWKGGDLIQVDSEIARATSTDLVINYPWVKAFVMRFRQSVPSGFFCTDVMLELDRMFLEKLLWPTQLGDTKQIVAAREGNRIKRLIGGLRALWRSSTMPRIVVLLSFFVLVTVYLCLFPEKMFMFLGCFSRRLPAKC